MNCLRWLNLCCVNFTIFNFIKCFYHFIFIFPCRPKIQKQLVVSFQIRKTRSIEGTTCQPRMISWAGSRASAHSVTAPNQMPDWLPHDLQRQQRKQGHHHALEGEVISSSPRLSELEDVHLPEAVGQRHGNRDEFCLAKLFFKAHFSIFF